ncbi:hypothetical protein THAOC_15067 [Thalassiosira oceanica]|uniref:Geranylgeranyl transferase type-2 subunit alpha n=1 Tax=Thalassiosira oceanica TaxID=159749 RepID=K0SFY6_THAOC|nr:hypothetical protein THAOC_15067 [Thalassiosira oceanica]|eukprot:EJK64220.1 hypothetical protein THAOC_15067 [Thalassiosira oceanica]
MANRGGSTKPAFWTAKLPPNWGKKATQWNQLSDEVVTKRGLPACDFDTAAAASTPSPKVLLVLTEKMLSVNPDPTHLWNIRREMLLRPLGNGDKETDGSGSSFTVESELKLTAHCLKRNPKAYATWFHRKWSLGHFATAYPRINEDTSTPGRFVVALLGSCGSACDGIKIEVAEHTSNFNGAWSGWANEANVTMGVQVSHNATAHPASLLSRSDRHEIIEAEWKFTQSKLMDNFSNGSATHYRTKLLPLMVDIRAEKEGINKNDATQSYEILLNLAREEWDELILNCIFTEPDDQTVWWYHRFVVSYAKPPDDVSDDLKEEYDLFLHDMAESLRELLAVEKESDGKDCQRHESKGAKCKWAYVGLHLVLTSLPSDEDLIEEAKDCLNELVLIDPSRRERYHQLLSKLRAP